MEITEEMLDIIEKVKGKRIPGLWDVRCQQYLDNKSKTSTKKAVKVDSTSQTISNSLFLVLLMAFFRGEEGSVKFKNASGTTEAVVSTTGWSLSVSKDTLDCTAHGATSRSYVGSLISGTGSVDFLYTAASGNETANLLSDVLTTEDAGDAQFELFLDTSGSKKVSFSGIVTSADFGAAVGDLQSVSVSFQTSGAITNAA